MSGYCCSDWMRCRFSLHEYLQLQDLHQDIYWLEGSRPFKPRLLLDWATRWIEIIHFASPANRARYLHGIADERQHDFLMQALHNYQVFAIEAIDEQALLVMRVV